MACSVQIVALVISVAVFQYFLAEALQCYECEGEPVTSDCAKATVSSMKVAECPGGPLAICRQTDVRSGDDRKFDRGCSKLSTPDLCTTLYRLSAQFPTAMRVFSCNTCDTPRCNI